MTSSSLPVHLDCVHKGGLAAIRGIVGSRRERLLTNLEDWRDRHGSAANVPVTAAQWRSVFMEAPLCEAWSNLLHSALEFAVVLASEGSAAKMQRGLVGGIEAVEAKWRDLAGLLEEILRFDPPGVVGNSCMPLELAGLAGDFMSAFFESAITGWASEPWMRVRMAAAAVDLAVEKLRKSSEQIPIGGGEEPVTRVLGLSMQYLADGDGITYTSRLTAAWMRDPEVFDGRLGRACAHLLDEPVHFRDSTRRHLTALIATDHPLIAHRVTLAAKQLVLNRLVEDEPDFMTAWEVYRRREQGMLQTHIGFVRAARGSQLPGVGGEQALDLAAQAYLAVVEGDVRRTAIDMLAFSGASPDRSMLLNSLQSTLVARGGPLAGAFASAINVSWRNSIAHRDMWWDASAGVAVLGDEAGTPQEVPLEALVTAASRARAICRAFDHGVEIAFNQARPPVRDGIAETPEPTRNMDVLDLLARCGIVVHEMQRSGGKVTLSVTHGAREFPQLLSGLMAVTPRVVSVERWEIRWRGRNLPPFCVESSWIDAVLARVSPEVYSGSQAVGARSLLLVLVVNGLLNIGVRAVSAVGTALALVASDVVAQQQRLGFRLHSADLKSQDQLRGCVSHVRAAVDCLAALVENEDASTLIKRFDAELGNLMSWSAGDPVQLGERLAALSALCREMTPHIPWITD